MRYSRVLPSVQLRRRRTCMLTAPPTDQGVNRRDKVIPGTGRSSELDASLAYKVRNTHNINKTPHWLEWLECIQRHIAGFYGSTRTEHRESPKGWMDALDGSSCPSSNQEAGPQTHTEASSSLLLTIETIVPARPKSLKPYRKISARR